MFPSYRKRYTSKSLGTLPSFYAVSIGLVSLVYPYTESWLYFVTALCIAMYLYLGNSMAKVFRSNYKFLDLYMFFILLVSAFSPIYIVVTEKSQLLNIIELFVAVIAFVNMFILAKLAKPEILERAGWQNVSHWGQS